MGKKSQANGIVQTSIKTYICYFKTDKNQKDVSQFET